MTDLPLFYAPNIKKELCLPPEESKHCLRVLRKEVGDTIKITDGQGHFYIVRIDEVERKKDICCVIIEDSFAWQKPWHGNLTLAVSPTKNADRMEWLIEKAVEVGVEQIVLLRTEHSERKHSHAERLERVAVSAMKQSLKAVLPTLQVDVPFDKFISDGMPQGAKLIAHCVDECILPPRQLPHKLYSGGNATIMIGPEGDFTLQEVKTAIANGFAGITLGECRLRTETAALAALQWLHTLSMINNL